MATIQEQIEILQNALASGTKSVTVGDRNITYNSTDELLKVLSYLKSQESNTTLNNFDVVQVNITRI